MSTKFMISSSVFNIRYAHVGGLLVGCGGGVLLMLMLNRFAMDAFRSERVNACNVVDAYR